MPAQLSWTLGVIPPVHDALVKYAPLLGFLLPLAAWGQETPTPRRLGLDALARPHGRRHTETKAGQEIPLQALSL